MTDHSLFQDFITESGEHLEDMERNLLLLKQEPGDAEVLNNIFRSIHTIKGSSEYLGIERVAELSHKLETLLEMLRRGECSVDDQAIDLLTNGHSRIGMLVGELDQHQTEQSDIDDLMSRLEDAISPPATDGLQTEADTADTEAYVDDEYDEELFGIFGEQLKEGLEGLVQDALQLNTGQMTAQTLESIAERLSTLRSSANYMGYDELKGRYEQWLKAVEQTLEPVSSDASPNLQAFTQDVMVGNIQQIQALFPKVPGLSSILDSFSAPAEEPAPTVPAPEASVVEIYPEETDQGLLADFIAETSEHLEDTERNLLRLEQQSGDADVLNDIFRSIHTIKGSSEYLGMERTATLSHKLESLLDLLRRGERNVDSDVIDLLISGNDRMGALVSELDRHQAEQSDIDDLMSRLDDAISPPTADGVQTEADALDVEADVDDEYDEELFGIFAEQLKEGLEGLVQDATQLSTGEKAAQAMESSLERLNTLRSSANYMGLGELKDRYDRWLQAVEQALKQVNGDNAPDLGAFTLEVMIGNIQQVQELFPKVPGLSSILDSFGAPVPAPEPVQTPAENGASDTDAQTVADETDQDLLADFITETGEHLEETERNLLRLEQAPEDAEVLNEIFRSIHTIKGSSEYLGMGRIAELSHKLESLLDLLRHGERSIDNNVIDLLIDTSDRVSLLMEEIERNKTEKSEIDDLVSRLDVVLLQSNDTVAEENRVSDQGASGDGRIGSGEQYDQELFSIFKTQFDTGVQVIAEETDKMNDAAAMESALIKCAKQLAILRSSANYMEYDDLKAVYEQWILKVDEVMEKMSASVTIDINAFTDEVMRVNLDRVHSFFSIEDSDTQSAVEAPEPTTAEEDFAEMASDTIDKVNLDLDAFGIDDLNDDSILDGLAISSKEDEDLMDTLASAFDANLGISDLVKLPAYPEDIESDLFSGEESEGGQPSDNAVEQGPTENVVPEDDAEPAEIESMLFSGGGPSRVSDKAVDLEPPTVTAPTPEAALPPESVPEETRSRYALGRRQSDKFRERMLKQSIRVDAAKIDSLMNQVGELVVSRSGFNQLFADMRELQLVLKQSQKLDGPEMFQIKEITNRISEATVSLGRVTTELQENVMKVRMLPIAQLFSRYPRLVHDLVRNTDKKVNLEIQGEETELDKMVIEQIADPLVHIIRNAVDHGIEAQGERRQKGKPVAGKLSLEAYHESNFVVIEIQDDGRGIDSAHVKAQAIEKGFVSKDEADEMSEDEVIALIMQPGFSTAREITTTSGRGVGMDVVKDNIEKLNGTIDIYSTLGAGARIRIKIPLTLAIIPALLVRVCDEIFTIPLATVDETLRVHYDEISTIEGLEVYYLRDNTVPLIRLDQVFNMPNAVTEREELFVVVVNSGAKQVGFVVDELKGRQEVVIKPLEDYLQEKSGFSGATILGDGGISLILDIFELIHLTLDKHAANVRATTA